MDSYAEDPEIQEVLILLSTPGSYSNAAVQRLTRLMLKKTFYSEKLMISVGSGIPDVDWGRWAYIKVEGIIHAIGMLRTPDTKKIDALRDLVKLTCDDGPNFIHPYEATVYFFLIIGSEITFYDLLRFEEAPGSLMHGGVPNFFKQSISLINQTERVQEMFNKIKDSLLEFGARGVY